MKNTKIVVPVVILLIGLGIGFGGGYYFKNYQLSKTRANFPGQFQGRGQMGATNQQGQRRVFQNGGMVSGEILSQDDKSITVKLADGSTKIVILGDSTTYSKTESGVKSDLKIGTQVGVFGTENSDGSVTAQNVQINPQLRGATPKPTP